MASEQLLLKLGADTSEFKGAIRSAADSVQNTLGAESGHKAGGGFVGAFEHRLLGARHLSGALATALGLNIEKISERIASIVTGVTEEAKKAYEEIERLSDQTVAAYDRMFSARRGDSQGGTALEEKRAKLLREMAVVTEEIAIREKEAAEIARDRSNSQFTISRYYEKAKVTAEELKKIEELKLALAVNEEALGAKKIKAIQEEARAAQTTFEHTLKTKTTEEQIAALSERRGDLEKQINGFVGEGVVLDEKKAQLQKTQLALTDAIAKQREEGNRRALEIEQERFDLVKENHERLTLEAKLITSGLLPAEQARLDILKIQTEEKRIQHDMDLYLATLASNGTLTKEEKKALSILQDQTAELKAQVVEKQKIIEATKEQVQEEIKAKQAEAALKEGHFSGDKGVMKVLGGFATYNSAADQQNYEKQLLASARRDIENEIGALQTQIDNYTRSGASLGKYELPALRERVNALRGREGNLQDFVFNPNYQDKAGKGIFAQQVETIGDPLKLQSQQTDVLKEVAGGVTQLNERLRVAGFGTGG